MNGIRAYLLAVLAVAAFTHPARAEKLVSELSTDTVEITSSFTGEKMTFFGSIEPEISAKDAAIGPYHVIIVVTGPALDRVAREKTRNFGVWLNTDQVTFKSFPSYYQVLSSSKMSDITNATTLAVEHIPPDAQPGISEESGWWKSAIFGRELIRLMNEQGLFGVNENAINFQSPTFYSARLTLPSDAPPGPYLAVTYIFKDGVIVARNSEGFAVRKIGFERFLAIESRQHSLLYGIVCVLLAVFTGWAGGVLFKRG
ncbi:TIGR02186 family protein [Devosia sp.]|uniref:TIGR02186 family protein n=1 Tax=Devosia sp. TaxID=1871048 RepID=UPI003267B508